MKERLNRALKWELPSPIDAQSFSVKRSQVEFHNFASLGDTDRAIADYLDKNARRAAMIQAHREVIGPMTPFLEIGANAGHTSYMLANQFAGEGFAVDLSADALRHGVALMDRWQLPRAPVRLAGDAVNLPFRNGSIQFVMACQMLSQFMNIESVFLEVKRVLAPGGVFLFTEEPLSRLLSLREPMIGVSAVRYQDRSLAAPICTGSCASDPHTWQTGAIMTTRVSDWQPSSSR